MTKIKKIQIRNSTAEFLVFTSQSGENTIEVRVQDETVWLTQNLIATLFQTTKQNVSLHLKNIFNEGELDENSVVKDFLTTAADGKNYNTKFYNLDAIISIGYLNESEFEKYRIVQDYLFESDFDKEIKRIEEKRRYQKIEKSS